VSTIPKALYELVREWRERAQKAVPPEYADRRLHGKYLRLDNEAAGWDEAADELEKQLLAWDEHFAQMRPSDDYWPPQAIRQQILGLPAKSERK